MKKRYGIILLACLNIGTILWAYDNNVFKKGFEKGNKLFTEGNFKKAIKQYYKMLEVNNTVPQLHHNLGIALLETKEYDKAQHHFKRSLELKPDYARSYYQLGRILELKNNKSEAIKMYRKAHEINSHLIEVLLALANLLKEENRFTEAIEYYQQILLLQPKNAQLTLDFANLLNTAGRIEESLNYYFKMLEMMPDNTSIIYNIAYTYKRLNKLQEAMPYYKRVLSLDPNHVEAHFSYSLALLLTGNLNDHNWKEGLKEYEWRWKRKAQQQLRTYSQPLWDGSSLQGKILFLWAEQGLGDTFQFIRYAHYAKQKGARKVIFAVPKPLFAIISEIPYIDQVIDLNDKPPYFDYHAPLLSMPYLTKTRLHNVPNTIPKPAAR